MTWNYGWISPTRVIGVAAYATSIGGFALAWVNQRRKTRAHDEPMNLFAALAGVQLALLLDMAFDWRWQLHAYGMRVAMNEGVYGLRRSPQLLGLGVLAVAVWCAACLILWRMRNRPGAALAVTGTLVSTAMWASEAVSYHYLDLILYRQVGGVMLVGFIWIFLAMVTSFGVWLEVTDFAGSRERN